MNRKDIEKAAKALKSQMYKLILKASVNCVAVDCRDLARQYVALRKEWKLNK